MTAPRTWGFAALIVIGVVAQTVALVTLTVHTVCVVGPVVGWSGPIASPEIVAMAPPGAFVTFSWWANTTYAGGVSGLGGTSSVPLNSTESDFEVVNWTLNKLDTSVVYGIGPVETCQGDALVPTENISGAGISGCAGCPVVPAATAGVGSRLLIPSQFYYGDLPSAVINATYGPAPLGKFEWNMTGSEGSMTSSPALAQAGIGLEFLTSGPVVGLGVTITAHSVHFGVPVRLVSGGTRIVPASFPENWPWGPKGATTFWVTDTYIFPATSAQGTWQVYLPGANSPLSPGGLLFEQVSTSG